MRVPVLTAVTDARWEADLVSAFESQDLGVSVVRRCVDLTDLLATASTGTARAALLSADLRRLDRDALVRLASSGVAVVALVASGDADAENRLHRLGVSAVLPADSGPAAISTAVMAAVAGTGNGRHPYDYATPLGALPAPPAPPAPAQPSGPPLPHESVETGRLIAVWGPTGAPGRTTVAVGLAGELARLDRSTLLVDADVYGGAVACVLGLLDESPGLAAAARLANAGSLDAPALARSAPVVRPSLRVLTGISRPDRWLELRPTAVETVLELARRIAAFTVVDCAFCLEQDEELSYDTAAPRRNGATLSVLSAADVVLAVGSADPVSLQRLVRGLAQLREAVPAAEIRVVVNRLRRTVISESPAEQVRAGLRRHAGVSAVDVIPYDRRGLDTALAGGRLLTESGPRSPARLALAALAADLTGVPAQANRRGWRRRQA